MLALSLYVSVQSFLAARTARLVRDQRGQASAEYALVLLGAAGIALLVMAWAKDSNKVGRLLDKVFESVIGRVK